MERKIINYLSLLVMLLISSLFSYNVAAEDINEPEVTKILFIGNSNTYYNSLPYMVKGLANADGKNVNIESITASGYKLYQYATTGTTYNTQIINTLSNEKWDYVVLQDNREPIIQTLDISAKAVDILKEYIDASGAKTILYCPQVDYNGRDFSIDGHSYYLDRASLQYYLTRNYYLIGNKRNIPVAAAGYNFLRCSDIYPEINLYNSDMLHPTANGSYLSACTIYQTIFGKSAYGNLYLPGSEYDTDNLLSSMDYETALKLQSVADPSIKLSDHYIEIKKGKSTTISASVSYSESNPTLSNCKNNISFYSTNDSNVSVNKNNGNITAINNGETLVMATSDNGLISMCTINVVQPSTAFTIEQTGPTKLHKKDIFTYDTYLAPEDTTDSITWSSSNPSVVSVDTKGTITATGIGTATVTAVTDSGIKLTRKVRVKLATPTKVKVKQVSTPAKNYKYANVKITWKSNKNAVKYYVYRSLKKKSGYKQIGTVTTNAYIDSNKKKGKTYYYKIKSVYTNTLCNSYRNAGIMITLK